MARRPAAASAACSASRSIRTTSATAALFVYYTRTSDGALVIERYERSATNPDAVDPASAKVLLAIPHPTYCNHNGGKLAFGVDGYLYVGTGDGGGSNDPGDNARRTVNNLGKMLRLDVDNVAAAPWYAIPPTNPFAGSTCNGTTGACPEIWALGLRNPWRFSFDRITGDLWIGDVGQGAREEVNLEPVGTPGGRNYGWRTLEGTICTPAFGADVHAAAQLRATDLRVRPHAGIVDHRRLSLPWQPHSGARGRLPLRRLRQPAHVGGDDRWTGRMDRAAAVAGGAVRRSPASARTCRASSTLRDSAAARLPDRSRGHGQRRPAGLVGERLLRQRDRAAANADNDGDGATNLDEFRAGTDPRLAESRPIRLAKPRDFDASGAADLLWRNSATGETAVWLMNGATTTSLAKLAVGAAWQVTHTGDLNADGRHDVLWRNDTTGRDCRVADARDRDGRLGDAARRCELEGHARRRLRRQWPDRSRLAQRRDGHDVAVAHERHELRERRDAAGERRVEGRRTSPTSTATARRISSGATTATGETAIWLMNGTAFVSGTVVMANAAWRAELAGDLDGDGRADLVWRNATTGEVALWLMNGASFAAGAIVLANAAWLPTHLADLNGDGRADILWRNTATGATNAWLMNGLALGVGGSITVAGSTVVATGDYDGDGRTDLVWNNPSTGVTEMRLMDGLAVSGSAVLLTSTVWRVTP